MSNSSNRYTRRKRKTGQYSNEQHSHIDSLVKMYQDGDKQAAEELIERFNPYLMKFFNILRKGVIDLSDYDSRKFISLFVINKEVRRVIVYNRQSNNTRHIAYVTTSRVANSFVTTDSEEIYSILVCVLLTLANRFVKKRVNFAGYVFNAYKFELYRTITPHTTDPLTYATTSTISYCDTEYIDNSDFTDDPAVNAEELHIVNEDMDIDYNWIHGLTCSEAFSRLTTFDRVLLKLSYVDGMSDQEISNLTGYHRVSITRKRLAIKKALQDYYENNRVLSM